MNVGVAVAVQIVAAALFWFFFRKPGWARAMPLGLALPFAVVGLSGVYLVAIPAKFLEEPDLAVENLSWAPVCSVPEVEQTPFATPAELWVRYSQHPNQYAVLTMPGCRLSPVVLPEPRVSPGGKADFTMDVISVIPGGQAVVQKWDVAKGQGSWWMAPGLTEEIAPGSGAAPLLSADGTWAGWLDRNRMTLRPLNKKGGDRVAELGRGSLVLRAIDPELQEVRLWQTDHLVVAGFDGNVKKEYPRAALTRPQSTTFLESGEHWLAWDAYRDSGNYALEWSLAAGSGTQRLPLGRMIHSAAFDAAEQWIAVSGGTGLNIGKARDSVWAFRAVDGREVFRKYLPRYTRSSVAFLEGGYFAYSDADGVHILQTAQ
jgi:hypothetical protein